MPYFCSDEIQISYDILSVVSTTKTMAQLAQELLSLKELRERLPDEETGNTQWVSRFLPSHAGLFSQSFIDNGINEDGISPHDQRIVTWSHCNSRKASFLQHFS
jgi:hypothetical protein